MRNPARLFLFLLFGLGLAGGIINGADLYIRLAYLSGSLLAAAWGWTFLSLRKLRLTRQARSLRASVGDIFEENFELENKGGLPRLWVEIQNHSDLPQAAGSRLITNLGKKQKRSYLARTWLTRRGVYRLGPTILASGDPFGLFSVKKTLPHPDSLLVLPLIVPITDFPSPAGYLPGGKASLRKSLDITPHASGVREYVHGDPLKRIHWPSSARRNRLMVKEFEQDPQAEIWLFLDAEAGIHHALSAPRPTIWRDWSFQRRPQLAMPPETIEYAVTISASLAHYFIGQRRAVGFVTEGPAYTVIPAERSERQEGKLLETLAFVRAEGRLPLVSLVDSIAPRIPYGSSALLVTSSTRQDILLAVENIARRGLSPLVILLNPQTFGFYESNDPLFKDLLARGVPVCQVAQGDNLAETLSAFAARNRSQEQPLWRKQLSSLSI
ncbi:MAG: DUF58 domain-containing protein [Anaerolineales bacterium]|jgi:uncharacterized protein (DUF58 family)|nr:DUF58 domain-containing protein [Anaerolineales bacterium]